MGRFNKSEWRPITATISFKEGVTSSIDALQAATEKIAQLEEEVYLKGAENMINIVDGTVAVVGTNRYKTYVFNVTTNFSSANYSFILQSIIGSDETVN